MGRVQLEVLPSLRAMADAVFASESSAVQGRGAWRATRSHGLHGQDSESARGTGTWGWHKIRDSEPESAVFDLLFLKVTQKSFRSMH